MLLVSVDWIQLTPPSVSMMATRAITRAKPRRARGPWYLLGIFMFEMKPLIGLRGENATGCHGSQHKKANNRKGDYRAGMKAKGKGENLVVERKGKGTQGERIGRPQKTLSTDQVKRAIEAARLGIPAERIAIGCGFHDGGSTWAQYLIRNPDFADQIREAQFQGELELASVVRSASNGWQGSAWLLERTRGYVARASLEHTGKGGKELSISGSLLGAFGGGK